MKANKVSFRCLDASPEMQDKITEQAWQFCHMVDAEADANRVQREEVMQEAAKQEKITIFTGK